jgi:hypothetical protein
VPQRSQVDWNFPVSVRDVVMMGRIGKLGLLRRPGGPTGSAVAQALEVVNLTDLAKRQISELSGGQQQRMFIARALAQEAELMLMDEPLTGLDALAGGYLQHPRTLREQRVTVLVALHDLKDGRRALRRGHAAQPPLVGWARRRGLHPENGWRGLRRAARLTRPSGWLTLGDTCCGEGGNTTMLELLLEPLRYPFMVRGLLAARDGGHCVRRGGHVMLCCAAWPFSATPWRMPSAGRGSRLPGGRGAREPLFWWALLTAVISALGIGAISRSARIKEDTAIGIIFAGMFALGIA